jgi:polyvinyl alcohol dehydrogenase (cytochrome)
LRSSAVRSSRRSLSAALLLASVACSREPHETAGAGGTPHREAGPPPEVTEADWTMLGFDLGSTYFNPHERRIAPGSVPNLEVAWTRDLGGPVTGAPAIVGNRVYATGAGLYAIDLENGEVLWRAEDVTSPSAPAYDDGTLYVHGSGSVLQALDAADGSRRWEIDLDDHPSAVGFSSPIVVGDLVIVGGSSGEEGRNKEEFTFRGFVAAVDKATGRLRWRHHTVEEPASGATVWSTVAVDAEADRVYATTGNNYGFPATDTSDAILALALESGDLLWKRQKWADDVFAIFATNGNPDFDFGANPILIDLPVEGDVRRLVAAGQKSGQVHVLDRETGEEIATRVFAAGNALLGGVLNNGAFDGTRLLFALNGETSDAPGSEVREEGALNQSVLVALDPLTLDLLWERQLPNVVWAPITVANGVGFVARDKTLEAFDTATGRRLFTYETEGTIACAPSIAHGTVAFGSGMTYMVGTPGSVVHALRVPR